MLFPTSSTSRLTLLFSLTCVCIRLLPGIHASVLVVGGTGRTGSLIYKELVESKGKDNVQALVRDVKKARDILNCNACDESEGVYIGDIRNMTSLLPAFHHVHTVVIATGVSGAGKETQEDIKQIEFIGVQNIVRALGQEANVEHFGGLQNLKVALISSEGTTFIPSDSMFSTILFYKLNAEAFLGSVGMTTVVVKPCGLSNKAGKNATLLTLHDDAPTPTGSRSIPRADLARVMTELAIRPTSQNLRFDLCSIEGPATTDIEQLLHSAQWGWEQMEVTPPGGGGGSNTIDKLAQLFFHHPFGRNGLA